MREHSGHSLNLTLNAVTLDANWDAQIRVGNLDYKGPKMLADLRAELDSTYVVRRCGDHIEIATTNPDSPIRGTVTKRRAGDMIGLLSWRLSEWLVEHFHTTSAPCPKLFKRRNSLVIVSKKPEDNLLNSIVPRNVSLPSEIAFRASFEITVRVERPTGKPQILITFDSRAFPQIDTRVSNLINKGVSIEGFYVRRAGVVQDKRLMNSGRLTGRIQRIDGNDLILIDHDEGHPTISAKEVKLEPRIEILADVIAQLSKTTQITKSEILGKLRAKADWLSVGKEKFRRIRLIVNHLRSQEIKLLDGHLGKFKPLISTQNGNSFPDCKIIAKPNLIFDPGMNLTDQWNQRGIDRHGPYDRYQFSPKQLNIALICQQNRKLQAEQFAKQLLYGVSKEGNPSRAAKSNVGLLQRFCLEEPYINTFVAQDASPAEYRKAAAKAVDDIATQNKTWNLALVQIEKDMESMCGDQNPYLETKAFFLTHGIAVQHVHLETMKQPTSQLGYSLNNIGLACYAKLDGTPWLLPSNQTNTHELIIGLGSHHECKSRFGVGDRHVGITTVFSGDGRYLLESRTHAVPFSEYENAIVEAVHTAVESVRNDQAWENDDPVRLIFHAFKPVKNIEVQAIQSLMTKLAIPHAKYAFLHVVDTQPFQIFNHEEPGVTTYQNQTNQNKGIMAPPRGLVVHLSKYDALLCLKGARELKQATDGHPSPLLLRLHRESSFQDLSYLAKQAFDFSCHSWRSFLPASLPITILYSQLVAKELSNLSTISNWPENAIAGRMKRTRWFL